MSAQVQLELEFEDEPKHLKDKVRSLAFFAGSHGITVAEVRERFGVHHGSASSALSLLERDGHLVRLVESRARCHLYVVPGSVAGRAVAKPRRARPTPEVEAEEVAEAFQRGRRNGREDVLLEVFRFAKQTREVVMHGAPVKRHDKQCFKQHPECALRAVMRFTQHRSGRSDAQQEAARTAE